LKLLLNQFSAALQGSQQLKTHLLRRLSVEATTVIINLEVQAMLINLKDIDLVIKVPRSNQDIRAEILTILVHRLQALNMTDLDIRLVDEEPGTIIPILQSVGEIDTDPLIVHMMPLHIKAPRRGIQNINNLFSLAHRMLRWSPYQAKDLHLMCHKLKNELKMKLESKKGLKKKMIQEWFQLKKMRYLENNNHYHHPLLSLHQKVKSLIFSRIFPILIQDYQTIIQDIMLIADSIIPHVTLKVIIIEAVVVSGTD